MRINKARIINNFIEPNKRQYSIPVYQRNYEWTKEQCVKLFQDIILAYKLDRLHFTGSIVYSRLYTENNIDHYVIIDGQQRFTTLFILIKALIDQAPTEKEKGALISVLFNVDKFERYNIDEANKLKLKPVKSDNQQLLLLMEDKFDQMDKNSGIYRNYELFCEQIKSELRDDETLTIAKIYDGIERLTCATIELETSEGDNAQEVFERINSTGLPLSLADKIRNFILMTNKDQETLYEQYWLKIESLVGYNNMTSFFLDYLNLQVDGFPKENESYDVFKEVFEKRKFTNEEMLKELLYYANFYNTFLHGNKKYSDDVNKYLSGLRKLKQTTIYLFLYRIFDDYEHGYDALSMKELEKVLRFLLIYTIRRMICEINSNSLRGLYKTLYNRIFFKEENKLNYYDSIISFFMQLSSRDALINDNDFVNALKTKNLYRKYALCKYLLVEIENQGKEQLIEGTLTVEHIMPQSSNLSSKWQKMLGPDFRAVQETYLHTLGNLTLTGYNSELGDRPFEEKKKMLCDFNSKIIRLNKDVINQDLWNEDAIIKRANNLSGIVLDYFSTEKPNKLIEFKEPGYNEYTCENPADARYKDPNYFILQGEKIIVSSFAELLKSFSERLYEIDSTIIEDMAKGNEKLFSWSDIIVLSYDSEKIKSKTKIKGTDIYIRNHNSADFTIMIVRALLEKYDIEESEFIYSARDAKNPAKR